MCSGEFRKHSGLVKGTIRKESGGPYVLTAGWRRVRRSPKEGGSLIYGITTVHDSNVPLSATKEIPRPYCSKNTVLMKCSCRLCGPQSWSIGSALRPLAGEAAVRPALSGRRGPRGCMFTSGNRVSSSACFLLFILYNSGQDTPKCKTSGLLSFHPS